MSTDQVLQILWLFKYFVFWLRSYIPLSGIGSSFGSYYKLVTGAEKMIKKVHKGKYHKNNIILEKQQWSCWKSNIKLE